ncbi:hypothetical protein BK816_07490 [Boudabousia tangfeifanii]|uniref:Uncharacterized protein n=1 Tax=Boudabousia tangfeifanii TaxID=1912795 RepID=A0A1D9MLH6_9ACTO|nr:hypothetical protein [Boudabousia tangfeifanii]AOZ73154.1 hypothetical protein BK816_07490 [Boudabousia tangfeifanii]
MELSFNRKLLGTIVGAIGVLLFLFSDLGAAFGAPFSGRYGFLNALQPSGAFSLLWLILCPLMIAFLVWLWIPFKGADHLKPALWWPVPALFLILGLAQMISGAYWTAFLVRIVALILAAIILITLPPLRLDKQPARPWITGLLDILLAGLTAWLLVSVMLSLFAPLTLAGRYLVVRILLGVIAMTLLGAAFIVLGRITGDHLTFYVVGVWLFFCLMVSNWFYAGGLVFLGIWSLLVGAALAIYTLNLWRKHKLAL